VQESNVNPVLEQVNTIQATRAYEANAVAAEATKVMIQQALRLLG
jgi:flagellar basal body rod protein FlgC